MQVNKIAVIGSGVMGSGIAAQAANGGLDVTLLDIVPEGATNRNQLAANAIEKQLKTGGFTHPKRAKLVRAGNLEDDLAALAECDWIIEVVVEKLAIKQSVYRSIESVRKSGSIVSSNTSTLPLATLIEGMPERFQRDFMITHFFNPPRLMRLLEVVPSPMMDKNRFADMCEVADRVFGKAIVPCKDTAGFIANRIGVYWMTLAMNKALEHGIRLEEVDALMGKPIGMPRTALFGLYDLIGIDLMPLIADAMRAILPKTDAFFALEPKPPLLANMIAEGYTGRKGKGGFYKMAKLPNGGKTMQALDLSTGEYHPALAGSTLESAKAKNIKELLAHNDMGGVYAKEVMVRALHYAASLIPEIADDIADVDTAMTQGYSWKFGPFELIDQLGVTNFTNYCQEFGLPVPNIIQAAGGKPLYSPQGSMQLDGSYQAKQLPAGILRLSDLGAPIMNTDHSKLWDMGDGVACFEITTKMHTIDANILDDLDAALDWVEHHAKALVIGSDANLFSAGANIQFFRMPPPLSPPASVGGKVDIHVNVEGKKNNTPSVYGASSNTPPACGGGKGGAESALTSQKMPPLTSPPRAGGIREKLLIDGEGKGEAINHLIVRGQTVMQKLKTAPFPVVSALTGIALGGGCETLLHSSAVQAHAEVRTGLVEVNIGVVPAWGGCKEMLLRHVAAAKTEEEKIAQLLKVFEHIVTAKTALSADEAVDLGITSSEHITMNTDRLLADAKQTALGLQKNYAAPKRNQHFTLPINGQSALQEWLQAKSDLPPHTRRIAEKLITILTNEGKATATEQEILDLERRVFMELVQTPETQARIDFMLENGKPLGN